MHAYKSIWLLNSDANIDRKISAHEFERGGLLKPIVNTIDGTPTFLSVYPYNDSASGSTTSPINSTSSHHQRPQRLSRNELKHLDEKQLIFELVRTPHVADWRVYRGIELDFNVCFFLCCNRWKIYAMSSMYDRFVTKFSRTFRYCWRQIEGHFF